MKIYQAGPLFTSPECHWHNHMKSDFEAAGHDVFWPGTTSDVLTLKSEEVPAFVFKHCKDGIDNAEIVVALLDGPQVDDGTAWECGYAYASGKPVIGIRTDFRPAGENKFVRVNTMIDQSCIIVLNSHIDVIEFLKTYEI